MTAHLLLSFAFIRQWQLEPGLLSQVGLGGRQGIHFLAAFRGGLADPLAEDGGVIPTEAQFGVRSKAAERAEGFRLSLVVVEKNVPLFALYHRQHIDVMRHGAMPC